MAALPLDPDEHGLAIGIGVLQRCRELEAMRRHDPIVALGGHDQRCGIVDVSLDVVQG